MLSIYADSKYINAYSNAYKRRTGDIENFIVKTKNLLMAVCETETVEFKKPYFEKIKTTPAVIMSFMGEINDLLLEIKACSMGSLLSYILNPTEANKPGDVDIWIPNSPNCEKAHEFSKRLKSKGWYSYGPQFMTKEKLSLSRMSPDVESIETFYCDKYEFSVQAIVIRTSNFDYVRERFDFEASKGFYSPFLHADGKPIGFRATKPSVVETIRKMETVYCEHEWDYIKTIELDPLHVNSDGDYLKMKYDLDNKSIGRLRKYRAKGYKIIASPKSKFTTKQLYEFMDDPNRVINNKHASYYDIDGTRMLLCNIVYSDQKYVMQNLCGKARIQLKRLERYAKAKKAEVMASVILSGENADEYIKPIEHFLNNIIPFFEKVWKNYCNISFKETPEFDCPFFLKDENINSICEHLLRRKEINEKSEKECDEALSVSYDVEI